MINGLENQNDFELYQKRSIEKIYSKREEHLNNKERISNLGEEVQSLQGELREKLEKKEHVQVGFIHE